MRAEAASFTSSLLQVSHYLNLDEVLTLKASLAGPSRI